MTMTRRGFLSTGLKTGLASATAPFWMSGLGRKAFAQLSASPYKAVVVITMEGGNDGNNLIVPMDPAEYAQYSRARDPPATAFTQHCQTSRACTTRSVQP